MNILSRMIKSLSYAPMARQESAVAARPDAIHATDHAPERFDIVLNALMRGAKPPMTFKTMPHMIASQRGIRHSLHALAGNPPHPKRSMPAEALSQLEEYVHSLGVAAIGYIKLPHNLIFRDKAVLYDNTIVLVMEMDKEKIECAPAPRAAEAVHETYHYLGDAANLIARYLRERGYGSHAGHPLNGLVLYPPLAQMAGLGWLGRHGMLITPQFGPRMRLAAVFTSIENLPFFTGENEHRWIEDFCRACGQCVRKCPPGAILEAPVERENGRVTCTDADRCFPYFIEHHGCSVCIKVCPFNRSGYEKIKRRG